MGWWSFGRAVDWLVSDGSGGGESVDKAMRLVGVGPFGGGGLSLMRR